MATIIKWKTVKQVFYTNYLEMAMDTLERDVILFSWRYKIKGMDLDDVAQELRLHLWRKLKEDKWNHMRGGIRTWAWRVMRNKLSDMSDYHDALDHELRVPFHEDEETEETPDE